MKNTLKIIHNKQIIQMDRTFEKLARNARSDEYALLQSVRRDYPNYKVTVRTINQKTTMEHYKGLTYEFMREHILRAMASGDKRATLEEFEEQIWQTCCHSKKYPAVKQWFLETYPEVKAFGMKKASEETNIESLFPFSSQKHSTFAPAENETHEKMAS